jgi:hypothetical protein
MIETILAVFFLVNGTPTTHPDFPPLVQPNMVICQERRANAQEYFDSLEGRQKQSLPEAIVGCYRKRIRRQKKL